MSFTPSFSVGANVTHQMICAEFLCGNMGGMRRSLKRGCLIIISDHTKALYDDKWYGDELHYTGMGKIGDQELGESQNRTLAESGTNGVEVHLFEVLKPAQYIYKGVVKLCGRPYQEKQKDVEGNMRKVWMFPLKTVHDVAINVDDFDSYMEIRNQKAQSLSGVALKEKATENSTDKPANRLVTSNVFVRDPYVTEYAKARANGRCQLCGAMAPFLDQNGKPYLESHHIIWLSKGGSDSVDNTVALCPNCHRKMHILNLPSDVVKLMSE